MKEKSKILVLVVWSLTLLSCGTTKTYYKDGTLKSEFIDDRNEIGYYPDGKKEYAKKYIYGKLKTEIVYYPSGEKKSYLSLVNDYGGTGIKTGFYKSGQKEYEEDMDRSLRTYYFKSGDKWKIVEGNEKSIFIYDKSKKILGVWIFYNPAPLSNEKKLEPRFNIPVIGTKWAKDKFWKIPIFGKITCYKPKKIRIECDKKLVSNTIIQSKFNYVDSPIFDSKIESLSLEPKRGIISAILRKRYFKHSDSLIEYPLDYNYSRKREIKVKDAIRVFLFSMNNNNLIKLKKVEDKDHYFNDRLSWAYCRAQESNYYETETSYYLKSGEVKSYLIYCRNQNYYKVYIEFDEKDKALERKRICWNRQGKKTGCR